jgi:hypothetical protein
MRSTARPSGLVRLPLLILALAGCGSAVPAATPTGEAAAAPVAAPAPLSTTASVGALDPAAPAKPATPEPEVLAKDSPLPGMTRLSTEEGDFVKKACTPLAAALEAAARKKKLAGPADRNAFLQEFLANPPNLPRVDVARCSDLLLRDLRAYLAATIESEAHVNIGRIVVSLATALELEPPRLCPSAGPVPADLRALAAGPWVSKADDWAAPGWACTRFDLGGQPQRFQYQLVTDKSAGTWEVVARGFPVKGGPPTELYARGRIEGGQIKPSREVFRRAVAK